MSGDISKSDLQRLRGRDWAALREVWLSYIPSAASEDESAESPSESLLEVQGYAPPTERVTRSEQVVGVRASVFSEALTLFRKAKHTLGAATRLQNEGFQTWSRFNYYHSAYLGAKSVMYLLGVTTPRLLGKSWLVDVFAPPHDFRSGKKIKPESLTDFMAIPIPGLDQHQLWAWFQRTVAATRSAPWDPKSARALHLISTTRDITRPRNHLLYSPTFWIAEDLVQLRFDERVGTITYDLDVDSPDFFIHLCHHVQGILDTLFDDLASLSLPVRRQIAQVLTLSPNTENPT